MTRSERPPRPLEDPALDPALTELWRAADASTRAPAGFDERLLARIEREAAEAALAPAPALAPSPATMLPWWVRAASERHAALALMLAAGVVAWSGWLLVGASYATEGGAALTHALELALAPGLRWLALPAIPPQAGLVAAACLLPAILWGSFQLAVASERWVRRAARVPAAVRRPR